MLPILRAMLLIIATNVDFIECLLHARNCCRSSLQKPANLNRDSNKAMQRGFAPGECSVGIKGHWGQGVDGGPEDSVLGPRDPISGVDKNVGLYSFETHTWKI